MLNALEKLPSLHQDSILRWKNEGVNLQEEGFLALVEENHAFNYQLWHAEDRARRDDCGAEFVYKAKREIDSYNQQRNNRMEAMDAWIFETLQPSVSTTTPVHSETPGMMIDRLSILALKAFHMALQTKREEVSDAHREACLKKLAVIHAQQNQLQKCLTIFFKEMTNGARTFRVYHQFKMYNDPSLNPELYGKKYNPPLLVNGVVWNKESSLPPLCERRVGDEGV